ncbi:MAG: gfo/Idh/MocA family oxidoreductase [Leptolyngbya sp. PLA3]|nr:MAG: gfo/Idh/MocA family oxidoreductase [Cyanobacteria bacterium CYA]MCE7968949.1 gfo/Idh/MocA family oxidoreductase [Leptolyngbya sp. PL-A3]
MRHTLVSRRDFLLASGGAACSLLILPRSAASTLANSRLRVGVVGVGGQGRANLNGVSGEEVVALCDVDRNTLEGAAQAFKGATLYRDYREMIATESLDAVVVSTPDHVHGPAGAFALRRGLHLYCEKPLAHSVYECRTMARVAASKNLATQMGTQIHAGDNYRRVVELIRGGAIGRVTEAHVWCGKSWADGRFAEPKEAPAHLDWNLWLGPRPQRPYCDGLHPGNWRRFWEFGTGTLGDMACHYMDLVFWALDLRHPLRVEAAGPAVHEVGTPDSLTVRWDFPQPDGKGVLPVWWYDGSKRPEALKNLRRSDGSALQWGDGQLFIGDKGMLISDYGGHMLLPESDFTDYQRPAQTIPGSIGHHAEWIRACKEGTPTTCNFEYSGALAEAVLLGNVAFRTGKALEWDGAQARVKNAPEAQEWIVPEFRAGFEV